MYLPSYIYRKVNEMRFLSALLLCFSVCTQCSLLSRTFKMALKRAFLEQDIEDLNALHKVDNHLVRRLIAMPLTDDFKPNQLDFMHEKIQYGDKCSLPSSLGRLIFEKKYEVPFLFEIKPVKTNSNDNKRDVASDNEQNGSQSQDHLRKAYISPLDFRAPENFIFLPKWLMNDLNLEPSDLVDISFIRMRLADMVVIQPMTASWDKLLKKLGETNLRLRLETELNKYSSLTAGSTVYIEIDGVEYPLFVKKTLAEGGLSVDGVRVQDSDLKTDIDRTILDTLKDEL